MVWLWLLVPVIGLILVMLWRVGARAGDPNRARADFLARREQLQRHFLAIAAASGKPRGLRWKSCEFDGSVEFVRDKLLGRLAALAGVTIAFEAIEGGDMEGVAAVGNLRNATAVFFYHYGSWETTGKAIFNLNPDEAVAHFAEQYDRLT